MAPVSDNVFETSAMSATRELSQVVNALISSSEVSPEATLCEIRAVVLGNDIFVSGEGELLYPQDRTFLVIELDELIERYGMHAAAREFTRDAAR
jgi:hypothetical protein